MSTITIEPKGLVARVFITPGANTVTAYGLTFDENADVVTETDSKRFSGFCDAEIVYAIAGEMLATRRQIEYADISDKIEELGLTCECDD